LGSPGAADTTPFVVKSTTSNAKDHFPAPERNYVVGMNLKF
jgi:hypothetical protein